MPRNQEVIRQWKLLHALESSRHGVTIDGSPASSTSPHARSGATSPRSRKPASRSTTSATSDGRVRWRLDGQVLHGLESGFTLPELCALYLSRNLLEAVAGTPFQRDLTNAFARLEKMLSPRMRQFLDRLPSVLVGQARPARAAAASRRATSWRACSKRRCTSASTTHAVSLGVERARQGLPRPPVSAGVRAGRAVPARLRARSTTTIRTFAVDRIASVSLEKQTFTPQADGRATTCSPTRSA